MREKGNSTLVPGNALAHTKCSTHAAVPDNITAAPTKAHEDNQAREDELHHPLQSPTFKDDYCFCQQKYSMLKCLFGGSSPSILN
jgi:hypothetical protein